MENSESMIYERLSFTDQSLISNASLSSPKQIIGEVPSTPKRIELTDKDDSSNIADFPSESYDPIQDYKNVVKVLTLDRALNLKNLEALKNELNLKEREAKDLAENIERLEQENRELRNQVLGFMKEAEEKDQMVEKMRTEMDRHIRMVADLPEKMKKLKLDIASGANVKKSSDEIEGKINDLMETLKDAVEEAEFAKDKSYDDIRIHRAKRTSIGGKERTMESVDLFKRTEEYTSEYKMTEDSKTFNERKTERTYKANEADESANNVQEYFRKIREALNMEGDRGKITEEGELLKEMIGDLLIHVEESETTKKKTKIMIRKLMKNVEQGDISKEEAKFMIDELVKNVEEGESSKVRAREIIESLMQCVEEGDDAVDEAKNVISQLMKGVEDGEINKDMIGNLMNIVEDSEKITETAKAMMEKIRLDAEKRKERLMKAKEDIELSEERSREQREKARGLITSLRILDNSSESKDSKTSAQNLGKALIKGVMYKEKGQGIRGKEKEEEKKGKTRTRSEEDEDRIVRVEPGKTRVSRIGKPSDDIKNKGKAIEELNVLRIKRKSAQEAQTGTSKIGGKSGKAGSRAEEDKAMGRKKSFDKAMEGSKIAMSKARTSSFGGEPKRKSSISGQDIEVSKPMRKSYESIDYEDLQGQDIEKLIEETPENFKQPGSRRIIKPQHKWKNLLRSSTPTKEHERIKNVLKAAGLVKSSFDIDPNLKITEDELRNIIKENSELLNETKYLENTIDKLKENNEDLLEKLVSLDEKNKLLEFIHSALTDDQIRECESKIGHTFDELNNELEEKAKKRSEDRIAKNRKNKTRSVKPGEEYKESDDDIFEDRPLVYKGEKKSSQEFEGQMEDFEYLKGKNPQKIMKKPKNTNLRGQKLTSDENTEKMIEEHAEELKKSKEAHDELLAEKAKLQELYEKLVKNNNELLEKIEQLESIKQELEKRHYDLAGDHSSAREKLELLNKIIDEKEKALEQQSKKTIEDFKSMQNAHEITIKEKSELNTLKEQLKKTNQDLENKLNIKDDQIKKNHEELKVMQKEKNELKELGDKLKKNNEELSEKITTTEKQKNNLEYQHGILTKDYIKAREEIEMLSNLLNDSKNNFEGEAQKIFDELRSAQEHNFVISKDKANLEQIIDKLKKNNEELVEQFGKIKGQKDQVDKILGEKVGKIKELENVVRNLDEEKINLEKLVKKGNEELKVANEEKDEIRNDKDQLEKLGEKLAKTNEDLMEKTFMLEKTKHNLEIEKMQLENKCMKANDEVTKTTKLLNEAKNKLEEETRQHKEELVLFQEEKTKLLISKSQLEDLTQKLRKNIDDLSEKLKVLAQEKEKIDISHSELIRTHTKTSEELEKKANEHKILETRTKDLEDKHGKALESTQEVTKNSQKLAEDLKKAQELNDQLNNTIYNLEEDLITVKKAYNLEHQNLETTSEDLNKVKDECQESYEKYDELNKYCMKITEECEKLNKDCKLLDEACKKFSENCEKLNEEKKKLTENLQKLSDELKKYKDQFADLMEKYKGLNENYLLLTEQKSKIEEEKGKIIEEKEKIKVEKDKIIEEKSEVIEESHRITEKLRKTKESKEKIVKDYEELSRRHTNANEEINRINEKYNSAQQRYESERNHLKKLIEELEKLVKDLQNQLSSANDELSRKAEEIFELTEENKNLITEKANLAQALKKEINELKARFDGFKDNSSIQINELNTELSEKEEILTVQRNNLQKAEADLKLIRDQLQELDKKYKALLAEKEAAAKNSYSLSMTLKSTETQIETLHKTLKETQRAYEIASQKEKEAFLNEKQSMMTEVDKTRKKNIELEKKVEEQEKTIGIVMDQRDDVQMALKNKLNEYRKIEQDADNKIIKIQGLIEDNQLLNHEIARLKEYNQYLIILIGDKLPKKVNFEALEIESLRIKCENENLQLRSMIKDDTIQSMNEKLEFNQKKQAEFTRALDSTYKNAKKFYDLKMKQLKILENRILDSQVHLGEMVKKAEIQIFDNPQADFYVVWHLALFILFLSIFILFAKKIL
ncbi:hypothetical protein SteCoe_12980 [Stentor coeruleus]|uniref:Uncharacterized protein n=1 Tax=Stentor coeruleus TaxID=5963 RepID=A0A1R2C9G0_9CILI|nr:hypothetical protein SteCoe_12980 [Stentor coeruleus]